MGAIIAWIIGRPKLLAAGVVALVLAGVAVVVWLRVSGLESDLAAAQQSLQDERGKLAVCAADVARQNAAIDQAAADAKAASARAATRAVRALRGSAAPAPRADAAAMNDWLAGGAR